MVFWECACRQDDDVDYKKAAGFQQHMKKSEAMSHFSKTKTMTEQREFLPIFQVKEDLLRVIRDNQVLLFVCSLKHDSTCAHQSASLEAGWVFRQRRLSFARLRGGG